MKKLCFLIMLFSMTLFTNAQTYVKFMQGTAADTLIKNTTLYKTANVNAPNLQTVSVQIMVDSVSGTPSGTATLYKSLDGVNFISTGVSRSWTTGRDTTFTLTDTTFYGMFARVKIVSTATTQKSKLYVTLKSWNK